MVAHKGDWFPGSRETVVVVVALLSLAAQSPTATSACPGGDIVHVPHMSRGRSLDANKQLEQWISGMKDRQVAGRVTQAFAGKIHKLFLAKG